ncbi:glycosyltransferase family 1 protein [Bacillus infantis]|uniref:glycosyltransferase family 1 protein n=1 Tax=Bacillus infantis TaxID=324767 RepID=UPI003450BFCE
MDNRPDITPVRRVLQITGKMNRGGAETMVMNLYREIDKSVTQFDFISYSEEEGEYDSEIKKMGGRIIFIPSPKKVGIFRFLKNFKKVNEMYGPYHAIHSHNLFNSGILLFCAKIIGIRRRICHAHSTSTSNITGLSYKIYKLIMRILINFSSTQRLACGVDAGKYLYGSNTKTMIFPNAINIDSFTNIKNEQLERCKKEIGCKKGELIIGNVGSFRPAKNHDFMIKIAEEMKNRGILFKMIFVGTGTLIEEMKSLVNSKQLTDYVVFLGSRDDVPVLMKLFDVLLMPSLYEGFPVTLVESQASNIVSVISDNITDEVDFNLDLVNRINLSASMDNWINAILEGAKCKNQYMDNEIYERLSERGYIINHSSKKLMKVYGI